MIIIFSTTFPAGLCLAGNIFIFLRAIARGCNKKVANLRLQLFLLACIYQALNACIIPKTDASISTHFQQ